MRLTPAETDHLIEYSQFACFGFAAFRYPNMADNDRQALAYSTPPLDGDIEVTGRPVVHLWVTSTADDGDFFVCLEEVDESG